MPKHRRSITSDWQNTPVSPSYVGYGPRSPPPQQRASCCSLDADVQLLLDGDEYEGYLSKSLKAATHRQVMSVNSANIPPPPPPPQPLQFKPPLLTTAQSLCGSLDADLYLLLDGNECGGYLSNTSKASTHTSVN